MTKVLAGVAPVRGVHDVTSVDLEHIGVRKSPFATFVDYRVKGRAAT